MKIATERYRLELIVHHAEKLLELVRGLTDDRELLSKTDENDNSTSAVVSGGKHGNEEGGAE